MPARIAAVALMLLLLGCERTPPDAGRSLHTTAALLAATPPPGAGQTAGGCGRTPACAGAIPPWLGAATGHNTPRGLASVIGTPPAAAAFLFARPLRAGHPENPANKILWAVRGDREGLPLELDGEPLGSATTTVHVSRPANSGPGGIYPSIVDVPSAGCWEFALRWATGRAAIDLEGVDSRGRAGQHRG